MNRIAEIFEDSWRQLIKVYEESAHSGKACYGMYYNEVEVVSGLHCLIKENLSKEGISAEVHLDEILNPKEWDIFDKRKGWYRNWQRHRSQKKGRKRKDSPHADIIVANLAEGEGNEKPFSVVAEVKFSMIDRKRKHSLQRVAEIEEVINQLAGLKEYGICSEAFFCYLDEYNEGELRGEMHKLIERKCGKLVRFHHDGITDYPCGK